MPNKRTNIHVAIIHPDISVTYQAHVFVSKSKKNVIKKLAKAFLPLYKQSSEQASFHEDQEEKDLLTNELKQYKDFLKSKSYQEALDFYQTVAHKPSCHYFTFELIKTSI